VCDFEVIIMADDSTRITPDDDCKVTKTQLLHFFEMRFAMADRDHDGQLNITELTNFLRFVTHPDLRALRSWNRYG
jgi:Ca2+-binding EF-hand superfamily protein